MTLKKFSITGLIIGILAVLASIVCPIISIALQVKNEGSIGIIGGADLPTFQYAFWREEIFVALATFGVPLVLIALVCLVFPNFVRENCGAKTTALSLAISATGCLGLLCLGEFIAIVAFEGPKRHPIAYPATIAVGIVALLVFITLFVLYCKARKGEVKIVGIVLDVFTGGIFMLFFLIAEVGLIEIARDVYHLLERLW